MHIRAFRRNVLNWTHHHAKTHYSKPMSQKFIEILDICPVQFFFIFNNLPIEVSHIGYARIYASCNSQQHIILLARMFRLVVMHKRRSSEQICVFVLDHAAGFKIFIFVSLRPF